MDMPDSELVRLSRTGDRAAFERLYRRYGSGLYRFVRGLVPSREDAEDITVQTFAKAWHSLDGLRSVEAFRTWLFRIAVRLVQDHRKAARPSEPLAENIEDPTANPETQTIEQERASLLRKAISTLSEDHRTVVLLYYGQQMKVEAIAALLRLPKNTVISRLARAREALRGMLSSCVEPMEVSSREV